MALCAMCATGFATACSCGGRNSAALSSAVNVRSEASGSGGDRRGRRSRLRPGLRNFLRLSEAMWCQFCLLCEHAF